VRVRRPLEKKYTAKQRKEHNIEIIHLVGYNSCLYLHSFSCCCLTESAKFSENVNDLGANRKRMCDFVLVIVTLDVSSTVFEILTLLARK